MSQALTFSSYRFGGQDELCLRTGCDHPKQILIIPPLFDEMNRMRRMLADMMRHLDDLGIGSALPDLPGTNESQTALEEVSLTLWKKALLACFDQFENQPHIASFRGGCLLDSCQPDTPRWRFAPAKGQSLLRTLLRTRIAADKEQGRNTTMAQLTEMAQTAPVNLAGHSIGPSLFTELQRATADDDPDIPIAQLERSAQTDTLAIAGSALWLRAEPDADPILSHALATALAGWVAT